MCLFNKMEEVTAIRGKESQVELIREFTPKK